MVRSTNRCNRRMLLLAPELSRVPEKFQDIDHDYQRHHARLVEMQRLRGAIYLKDGAIETNDLSSDGRHEIPADLESWHLLALDPMGRICGCLRFQEHKPRHSARKLSVSESPLAMSDIWAPLLSAAMRSESELARSLDFSLAEVGGWAISEEFRFSWAALQVALSAYSLARMLGGCIGITTATARHSSASILRRIGGSGLRARGVELPPYYDPSYKCEMVILRFDSSAPDPRYSAHVDELDSDLPFIPVVCANRGVRHREQFRFPDPPRLLQHELEPVERGELIETY